MEKQLNRLADVTATVNFATGTARVSFDGTVTPGVLVAAVEQAGYTAAVPRAAQPEGPRAGGRPGTLGW